MRTLSVSLPGRKYDIEIKKGILGEVGFRVKSILPKAQKLSIVTDSNVFPLYADTVVEGLKAEGFITNVVVIPAGERSKNLGMLEKLYKAFTDFGLTRSDAIIALGGGVVGDLAGFAAATIFRGIAYIQVPTTLLAQVDSSVGGKTAIDLKSGKNLVGAFWLPKAVFMDPLCLNTLTDKTFSDGMAEVIKYGCISDGEFFDFLEDCGNRAGIMKNIEELLYICCQIKAGVVTEDETDVGIRMILNFGHTLGHAYELAGYYEEYAHGQAVAAGMCMAAKLGVRIGVTSDDVTKRIEKTVRQFGLLERIECSMADYEHAIGLDKKGAGDNIKLIMLSEIGKAEVVQMEKSRVFEMIRETENTKSRGGLLD